MIFDKFLNQGIKIDDLKRVLKSVVSMELFIGTTILFAGMLVFKEIIRNQI